MFIGHRVISFDVFGIQFDVVTQQHSKLRSHISIATPRCSFQCRDDLLILRNFIIFGDGTCLLRIALGESTD